MPGFDAFPSLKTSGFPLSMGTGLAFESLFPTREAPYDPERVPPSHARPGDFDTAYFNLTTLIRNIMAAVDKTEYAGATPERVISVLLSEVDTIQNLFQIEGGGVCKPVFYYCEYRKLKGMKSEHINLREPSTENQKFYHNLVEGTLKKISRLTDSVIIYPDAVEPKGVERSLIMTHLPYDLISVDKFSGLELLESNTGVIKPRVRWNTKYTPIAGEDLSIIPFCRKMLLVFGDKNMIQPFPIKARKSILKVAKRFNWTGLSTIDRVNTTLTMGLNDPYFLSVLNTL